jgi:hypothetical protein
MAAPDMLFGEQSTTGWNSRDLALDSQVGIDHGGTSCGVGCGFL